MQFHCDHSGLEICVGTTLSVGRRRKNKHLTEFLKVKEVKINREFTAIYESGVSCCYLEKFARNY